MLALDEAARLVYEPPLCLMLCMHAVMDDPSADDACDTRLIAAIAGMNRSQWNECELKKCTIVDVKAEDPQVS